jgi:hypothetical protein
MSPPAAAASGPMNVYRMDHDTGFARLLVRRVTMRGDFAKQATSERLVAWFSMFAVGAAAWVRP